MPRRATTRGADGRLAVFGAGAARLHEEVIPVTAIWTESERHLKPLRALGESGEEKTLNQLEAALREARAARAQLLPDSGLDRERHRRSRPRF